MTYLLDLEPIAVGPFLPACFDGACVTDRWRHLWLILDNGNQVQSGRRSSKTATEGRKQSSIYSAEQHHHEPGSEQRSVDHVKSVKIAIVGSSRGWSTIPLGTGSLSSQEQSPVSS